MNSVNLLTVDPETLADAYTAVWSEPDADRRRATIARLWARDGVEYVEGNRFGGHAELVARVADAYAEFVASSKYRVTRAANVACFGQLVTLTIQLVSHQDDALAWAARVFLLLDDDGRILEDYQLTVQPLAA
jgi:hypothetical protein